MKEVLESLAKSYSELPKRSEFTASLKAFAVVIGKALADVDKRVNAKLATVRNGRDGRDGSRGPRGEKGEPGKSIVGPQGAPGTDGTDGSPDSAYDIRNKLELLEDDERLKIEAIKNLREELDELREKVKTGGNHTFAIQRGQMMTYDLSEQLNGVLKTFVLPAYWRIISVQSTSTPVVFRPIIDFTSDASVPSITFTSAIDASTTLAAGQSLLVIYATP